MNERTRILIYLFAATVVVASCSQQSLPLAPEASGVQPSLVSAASGCPSAEEVCAEIRPIVQSACPPDGAYRNNGDKNKCRKAAFDDAIKPYNRCFTKGEVNAIRRAVMRVTPGPHAKNGTDECHEEPNPGQ